MCSCQEDMALIARLPIGVCREGHRLTRYYIGTFNARNMGLGSVNIPWNFQW